MRNCVWDGTNSPLSSLSQDTAKISVKTQVIWLPPKVLRTQLSKPKWKPQCMTGCSTLDLCTLAFLRQVSLVGHVSSHSISTTHLTWHQWPKRLALMTPSSLEVQWRFHLLSLHRVTIKHSRVTSQLVSGWTLLICLTILSQKLMATKTWRLLSIQWMSICDLALSFLTKTTKTRISSQQLIFLSNQFPWLSTEMNEILQQAQCFLTEVFLEKKYLTKLMSTTLSLIEPANRYSLLFSKALEALKMPSTLLAKY